VLAHGGSPDEQVAMVTVVAGLWLGWAGVTRIRDRGFPRLPLGGAWSLAVVGAVVVIAGLTLPRQFVRPNTPTTTPSGTRPPSTATLAIDRPAAGQKVSGDQLEVVIRLDGGHIVDSAGTALTPDTGHIHLSLDGKLVSMTYGLVQLVDVHDLSPGEHTLEAEFVAADHGPFDPRVVGRTTFTIGGGP
jgi:hypothetical protein